MLKKIKFTNYRCFPNNIIYFKDISIIVGKNNAGKSTIVEALRLVAFASKKCVKTTFTKAPKEMSMPSVKGFKISPEQFKIDLRGIINYYQENLCMIEACFVDTSKIIIHLDTEHIFATIYDRNNRLVRDKNKAKELNLKTVDILPQIGLIKENEKKLSEITILSDMDTYLSSRHFRNELLHYKSKYFSDFKKLAQETWDGLIVKSLEYDSSSSEFIQLLVEDDRFTSEIGLMGSGLQMWLQIIWFISRTKGGTTTILDEPDVYMHPDLQRKLLLILRHFFPQIIIATHSIEIISQVEPNHILNINKKITNMKYASDMKSVQYIIDSIGSIHNLSLARLASAKKMIFVEGEDIKLLSKVHQKIYPNSTFSLETLPHNSLGGRSRLSEIFTFSKLLHEETNGNFKTICILDRDYFTDEQIQADLEKAKDNNLLLYIWSKKEIENYFIIPKAIFRLTMREEIEYGNFLKSFEEILDEQKDNLIDQIAQQIQQMDRKKQLPTCNDEARAYVKTKWTSLENKIGVVSGKILVRRINNLLSEKYDTDISLDKIINGIALHEFSEEIIDVIEEIISEIK